MECIGGTALYKNEIYDNKCLQIWISGMYSRKKGGDWRKIWIFVVGIVNKVLYRVSLGLVGLYVSFMCC